MFKKIILGLVSFALVFSFFAANVISAENESVIEGVVEKIADDSSSIVVGGKEIVTTKEFLEDADILVGDRIKVTVAKDGNKVKAVNSEFIFGEEMEEVAPEAAAPAEGVKEAPAAPETAAKETK